MPIYGYISIMNSEQLLLLLVTDNENAAAVLLSNPNLEKCTPK